MPWNEATVMRERVKMAAKWASGLYSPSELAREFGVSRPTVYELIKRVQQRRSAETTLATGWATVAPPPRSSPSRGKTPPLGGHQNV